MVMFRFDSRLNQTPDVVHAWHARPGAFERLSPPWEDVRLLERSGGLEAGAETLLELRKGTLKLQWHAVHEEHDEEHGFVDRQTRGPFARWVHRHLFRPENDTHCAMRDEIDYELPLAPLGRWFAGARVARDLKRTFAYRHGVVARDIDRHQRTATRAPLRIAITGASGLVGSRLAPFLTAGGHEVLRLVRRPPTASDEIHWDPDKGNVDADSLEDLDAVIHLAGESIASGRWNDRLKERIRDSRVRGTSVLSEALAGLERPPKVLVAASAIGYYGDRADTVVDENNEPGSGFLADVCTAWEAATTAASTAGVRVVNLRIGIVLAADGGALAAMLPAFRLGAGGRVGSGRQWMSWIAIDDLIGAIHHCLTQDSLAGPVNAVAPNPVTNRDFTRVLARVMRRPSILPVPSLAIRTLLGEMGDSLLLASTRVRPQRLEDSPFTFQHPDLEAALRVELGRENR